ncbi:MAG: hypothetical protein CL878_13725 [Dehalococcoidia bacterium]|nr:hypothetical protein [Dehalococcoidia bacterium]
MRWLDPVGLGLAAAVLLAAWLEPVVSPGTAAVETRLDIIVGLGLPFIFILAVAEGLWRRWRVSSRPSWGRGGDQSMASSDGGNE